MVCALLKLMHVICLLVCDICSRHLCLHQTYLFCAGRYKVEVLDKVKNEYVPTSSGLGMHVEVRDPDDKIILSRVR